MKKQLNICFFTGKRGGYAHMVPIIEKIKKSKNMTYNIVGADMHMASNFGSTIEEVQKWTKNCFSIDTMLNSDSKVARAKSLGLGIISFSQLLDNLQPDLVFVLGDRGEVLAFAISALELNIPIVHLFGGDITRGGGVDEPVRHAITKIANIHLASNQESANRVLKMGEEPWRVNNVGSPVLDLIYQKRFTPAEKIKEKFRLDIKTPILLLLQHSVTWQVENAEYQIRQTMEAIDHLGYQTIAVYPCSDPGYGAIIKVLSEYEEKPYFQLFKNIEFSDFWGLMNIANVFIGNSSAGVMETASFKIPFVNIGIRQEGRLRADNVIDVDHKKDQIIEAIQIAVSDKKIREKVNSSVSPYGDGKASEKIVSILQNIEINEKLINKKMTY